MFSPVINLFIELPQIKIIENPDHLFFYEKYIHHHQYFRLEFGRDSILQISPVQVTSYEVWTSIPVQRFRYKDPGNINIHLLRGRLAKFLESAHQQSIFGASVVLRDNLSPFSFPTTTPPSSSSTFPQESLKPFINPAPRPVSPSSSQIGSLSTPNPIESLSTASSYSPPTVRHVGFLSHAGAENLKRPIVEKIRKRLNRSGYSFFIDSQDLKDEIPGMAMLKSVIECEFGVIFFSQTFWREIFPDSNGVIKRPWPLLELRILLAKQKCRVVQVAEGRTEDTSTRLLGVCCSPHTISTFWEEAKTLPLVPQEALSQEEWTYLKRRLQELNPEVFDYFVDPTLTVSTGELPFIEYGDNKPNQYPKQVAEEILTVLRKLNIPSSAPSDKSSSSTFLQQPICSSSDQR